MNDDDPLLEAEDLVKSYRDRRVLDQVSIQVAPGEIVGLLGPNGAGKTTTFRIVLGLMRPDSGRVVFDGRDVTEDPVHRRARAGMGYLAQEPSVFRGMTVLENVLAVLEWVPGLGRAERRDRALLLLERFRVDRLADQRAGSLSGGEKRRLEIARVLALEPTLILLDEPFANIDPLTVEDIQSILVTLRDQGIGILLTDHNVRETLDITDRSYILVDGRVFRHGPTAELVEDPMVRKTYLGQKFLWRGEATDPSPQADDDAAQSGGPEVLSTPNRPHGL